MLPASSSFAHCDASLGDENENGRDDKSRDLAIINLLTLEY
jgi:hypothetical protein